MKICVPSVVTKLLLILLCRLHSYLKEILNFNLRLVKTDVTAFSHSHSCAPELSSWILALQVKNLALNSRNKKLFKVGRHFKKFDTVADF